MSSTASTPKTPKADGKTIQRQGVDKAISERLTDLRSVLKLNFPKSPTKRVGKVPLMSNGSAKQLLPGDEGFENLGRWIVFVRAEPHLKQKGYVDFIGERIPIDVLENDTELKSLWEARRLLYPSPRKARVQPTLPKQPTPPSSPIRSSPTPAARPPRTVPKRSRQEDEEDTPSTKKAKVLEVIEISSDEEEDEVQAGSSNLRIILLLWHKTNSFPLQVPMDADPRGMLKLGSPENRRRLHGAGISSLGLFRRYLPREHDWLLSSWEIAFQVSTKTKVVAMKVDDIDIFADGCGWGQYKRMFVE